MILDSEAQRQNLLRLLDWVQVTGAEAEVRVEQAWLWPAGAPWVGWGSRRPKGTFAAFGATASSRCFRRRGTAPGGGELAAGGLQQGFVIQQPVHDGQLLGQLEEPEIEEAFEQVALESHVALPTHGSMPPGADFSIIRSRGGEG